LGSGKKPNDSRSVSPLILMVRLDDPLVKRKMTLLGRRRPIETITPAKFFTADQQHGLCQVLLHEVHDEADEKALSSASDHSTPDNQITTVLFHEHHLPGLGKVARRDLAKIHARRQVAGIKSHFMDTGVQVILDKRFHQLPRAVVYLQGNL
jgi:hypothetical protein